MQIVDPYPTRLSGHHAFIERTEPTVWADHPDDGSTEARQLAAYERDGYLRVPGLLFATEVDAYRAEARRLAEDPVVRRDERCVLGKSSGDVRSIFEVHRLSGAVDRLLRDERVLSLARRILDSDVYVHQSRVNYQSGLGSDGFYWHSDFETWHAEDGMPVPRAVSCSILLTDNRPYNGSLMILPGSHRTFVPCVGDTPADNHLESLREQRAGTPDPDSITRLAARHGIDMITGDAGDAVFFDANCMHGSSNNISPFPRSNLYFVLNSVHNVCVEPYAAAHRRPQHLGSRPQGRHS